MFYGVKSIFRIYLACLESTVTADDWESDDSSNSDTSDSVRPDCISSPHRKNLSDGNNISRKQGHVIIPLNCSSEVVRHCHEQKSQRNSPLADTFFHQLSNIQTETRQKLREAKSEGKL